MNALEVRTGAAASPLTEVRRVLNGADEALMCVAFVHARGLNLVAAQLPTDGRRTRLLATTAFGTTTAQGLALAQQRGVEVRILNPAGGSTYHPKVYLGRHGKQTRAVVGSANLTGGLATNIESVVGLAGESKHQQLGALWEAAEGWWSSPMAMPAAEALASSSPERLPDSLRVRLELLLDDTNTIYTLADERPNRVAALTDDGLYVETNSSTTPQLVPAWMITIAWEWLTTRGTLTNRFLLADDGLNVKRSSFVCALLAALPDVEVVSRRPITLRHVATTVALAAEPRPSYQP